MSCARTLVVPSHMALTWMSRYRTAIPPSSTYPCPPRDSMHSDRNATPILAVVAFRTGVRRRRRRRSSCVAEPGISDFPSRVMMKKVKWVMMRSCTDSAESVRKCNGFSLRSLPKTLRFPA